MVAVSGTRLQARRWNALPFLRASMKAARQAEQSDGFLGGAILKDRYRAYWTVTLWRDLDAMTAYRNQAPHRDVMADITELAEGFVAATWDQDDARLPSWKDVHARLREQGRVRRFGDAPPGKVVAPMRTTFMIRLKPRP